MLVLTRKAGEELVIGGDIRLTVTRIAGNRVTLGVSAPREVNIARGELQAKDLPVAEMDLERVPGLVNEAVA